MLKTLKQSEVLIYLTHNHVYLDICIYFLGSLGNEITYFLVLMQMAKNKSKRDTASRGHRLAISGCGGGWRWEAKDPEDGFWTKFIWKQGMSQEVRAAGGGGQPAGGESPHRAPA